MILQISICLSFILAFVSFVSAEPVKITTGIAQITDLRLNSKPRFNFSISNESSSFSGNYQSSVFNSSNVTGLPLFACKNNCKPGDIFSPKLTIIINGNESSPILNVIPASLLSTPTATINDISFSNVSFSGSQIQFSGTIDTIPNSDLRVLTTQLPFFLSAKLVINQTTEVDVNGLGLAKFFYIKNSQGTYDLEAVTYNFESGPEPTPEPTTILLMAMGLAGIGGFVSKRRNKKLT